MSKQEVSKKTYLNNGSPLCLVLGDANVFSWPALLDALMGDFQLYIARTGEEVVFLCQKQRPAALLLDVTTPGIDGSEVCRRLKADAATRDIAVIFVAAHELSEERWREAGATGFICRSLGHVSVRQRIQAVLNVVSPTNAPMVPAPQRLDSARDQVHQHLKTEWGHCLLTHEALALMCVDVDYLDEFFHHYGLPAGKNCLNLVGNAIRGTLHGPYDFTVRYGEQGFICILPATRFEAAVQLAGKIELMVRALGIPHRASEAASVITVSIGVAAAIPDAAHSLEDLMRCAELSKHAAQNAGHARVWPAA